MSCIYFILHGPENTDLADRLSEELRGLNHNVTAGQSPGACDVLVVLRHWTPEERAPGDTAPIVVQINEANPKVPLLARGLAELSTATALINNAQITPYIDSESRVVAAARTAFDAVSIDVERHPVLVQVDTLLRAAQELAESLSQTAQFSAALSLYEYSTETLIRLASAPNDHQEHEDILGTIAALLQDVLMDALTEGQPEDAVDAFVDAYEHVLSGLDTSYAMQNLDSLIEDIIASGRPITPALVCDVLNLAFSHGEPLSQRGSLQWVLQLYLLAAQGILRMLGVNSGQRSLTAQTARDLLSPYEELDFEGPVPDAEILVDQLSQHLYVIRDSAQGERAWEHDS